MASWLLHQPSTWMWMPVPGSGPHSIQYLTVITNICQRLFPLYRFCLPSSWTVHFTELSFGADIMEDIFSNYHLHLWFINQWFLRFSSLQILESFRHPWNNSFFPDPSPWIQIVRFEFIVSLPEEVVLGKEKGNWEWRIWKWEKVIPELCF